MMRVIRLLLVTATVLPVTAFAQTPVIPNQAPSFSANPLGGVSPKRAFNQSVDGKAAIARLTAFQNEKAREIDERNKALQSQEQAFEKSAPLLSEDARAQKSKEVQRFRLDVERFIQDAQEEFLGVQRDLETSFLSKFHPAVAKVAKEKGFQLIFNLDQPFVTWFGPLADITPDVVKQLAEQ
jgi:outer membrane protein